MSVHPRTLEYTESLLPGVIPLEAELTAGTRIEPGRSYGFFTDTTLCIGCKACEVACKEWNELPAEEFKLTGDSYDNTGALSATTWRHVSFIEKLKDANGDRATELAPFQSNWLMMSDVCKHCSPAPCLESCPTGALFRTEFDTVVVQQDICNGCGYCVPACPFGVVELNVPDGKAHAQGRSDAYLYGAPDTVGATNGIDRLNAFFLLTDRPEVYNLPPEPSLPSRRVLPSLLTGLATMAGIAIAAIIALVGE